MNLVRADAVRVLAALVLALASAGRIEAQGSLGGRARGTIHPGRPMERTDTATTDIATKKEGHMEHVGNRIAACGLAALLSLGMGRSAAAQMADTARATDTTAVVTVEAVTSTTYRAKAPAEPPALRPETKGAAPSAKAVWVPGFWDLRGDRRSAPRAGWVWVPGQWIEPPVPHARWDPGHWGWSDEWYSWVPAHWVVPGRHGYPPTLQADEATELETSAP